MDANLIKKLLLKPGMRAAVLNPPEGYLEWLCRADKQILEKLETPLDFVQVFVKTQKEVEKSLPAVIKALRPDGLLWVCYPKGTSKVKTDLNRDVLWAMAGKYGITGVSLISIDATWSGMRFRPVGKVGK